MPIEHIYTELYLIECINRMVGKDHLKTPWQEELTIKRELKHADVDYIMLMDVYYSALL